MNKATSTALLGMLALANAGLDYSAVCVFLDVDPFGTFSPNNFFAGLVAVAQSLLLIILPWVASEKIAAGEKGPAAYAIIGSLFVAMAGAFLRATTEAASTTTSVSGEVVSGLSIDGMAFVLIMAGIALGEAINAFICLRASTFSVRTEAEALQAKDQAPCASSSHARQKTSPRRRCRCSPLDMKPSPQRRVHASRYSSSLSRNWTTATTVSSDSWTKSKPSARRNASNSPTLRFSTRIPARKYPDAIAAEQKAPTAEAAATNATATNSLGKGGDAAADVDAAAANPTGTAADAETAVDASETVGDPSAGATPNDTATPTDTAEKHASDQAKAA